MKPRLEQFLRYARLGFVLIVGFGGCDAWAGSGASSGPDPLPRFEAAIAMHGAPKYKAGFTAFDYVRPDAPFGGALRLGVVGTYDSLHPFIVLGRVPVLPAFQLVGAVYEQLMVRGWDEAFTLYGLLADGVSSPPDRSSVAFRLNQAARWQDGRAVTADDILFSYETLRDKGRPNHRTYYKKVLRADRLDDRTVRFVFKPEADGGYDREMPLIMGLMPILPRHIWQDRPFAQTSLTPPIGSGPYKVTHVDPGRSLVFERDPAYWGRDLAVQRGMYRFDRVRFDFYRDDSVALQAFGAGAYDLRRETDPTKWSTAYDKDAIASGRLRMARFDHGRTEAAYGFVINLRRPLFADPVLRAALARAYDFGWINKILFHGLYRRSHSFFPNSALACDPSKPPQGAERALLAAWEKELGPRVMGAIDTMTTDGGAESLRDQLEGAAAALRDAGYVLRDGQLFAPSGPNRPAAPVAFEVLLRDPVEEKIALGWARNLARLGITARVRTVDSAQYQARLSRFDYDVTTGGWSNSLSPGNEQIYFWGQAAAQQEGSKNYTGLSNAAIDALARQLPRAESRDALLVAARAFDRALLAQDAVILFWHLGSDLIAYWPGRIQPPPRTPLYGPIIESWFKADADPATVPTGH